MEPKSHHGPAQLGQRSLQELQIRALKKAGRSTELQHVLNRSDQVFDWRFYLDYYEDLNALSTYAEAYEHWVLFGQVENRFPNYAALEQHHAARQSELPNGFNPADYLQLNPAVDQQFAHHPYRFIKATEHYLEQGRLQNLPYQKPSALSLELPLKGRIGRIDGWENGCIRGWAIEDSLEVASLEVYLDGVFYTHLTANLLRPDILKRGFSDGYSGFEIPLPFLKKQQSYQIDVVFQGSEAPLQNSPYTFQLSPLEQAKYQDAQLSRFASVPKLLARERATRGTTIIIPIYNAYSEVQACLQSVIANTSIQATLLLINDASTDQHINTLLEWAATHSQVKVVHHQTNLGYTQTVNQGIQLAGSDDVILLNSDTVVGSRWLQQLQIAAYSDVDIATVTALSNNAGAFSAPDLGRMNDLPKWLTLPEAIRAVSQSSQHLYPEVPTGNGFCLYIRRDALDQIGVFDEAAFPRGYGEENDFCMRALWAGWRHLIADHVFVYHVRSASFQDEKAKLIQAGRQILDQRYPEYQVLTEDFTHSLALQSVRYGIRRLFQGKQAGDQSQRQRILPRVLYVISTQTGGTPQTNQDLMRGLSDRYHPFLLRCNSQEITLYDMREQACTTFQLKIPISPVSHRSTEYDQIISSILIQYGIELLHIRHIGWHSLSLPWIAKQLGIPVIFSFHDFYTICPTVNLLDENQVFCGGRCTATTGQCKALLWNPGTVPPLKHQFIGSWQRMMSEMLKSVDVFVTTSDSAKKQLETIYPTLKQSVFEVIPHGRDFPELGMGITLPKQPFQTEQPLKILCPGNINQHKGSSLIAQLHQLDQAGDLEFHFLGTTDPCLAEVGKHHGAYQREDFIRWVQQIQPHYVGIFSIWPETYCHTLTESWASGVPVIALDQGAVGERIRKYGGGWLLRQESAAISDRAADIYSQLLKIAGDPDGYAQRLLEVRHWQRSYGKQNNVSTMAARYHQLYQHVVAKARPFTPQLGVSSALKVGVFVSRDFNGHATPSVHIRALEWLNHPSVQQRLDAQFVDIQAFLQDEYQTFDLDLVLVQRNTIKPHLVQAFIETCAQRHLPIVFELDDDLLHVPFTKDPWGIYAQTASAVERMARAATAVIVSTEPLADRMRALNPNITVIPNALCEFAWFRPIESKVEQPPELEPSDALKVLYMGNPTHAEDLAIVRPVFERLRREGQPTTLYVIGGEPEDSEVSWYKRLAIPNEFCHYPEFVGWFRSIAPHFNLAIAPLEDTAFNRCKSALKFLQYAAVELPGLYSDCLPYQAIIQPGKNGVLVENSEEAWYRAIVQCLNASIALETLKQAAKREVLAQYLISHLAKKYTELFERIVCPQKL